MALMSVAVSTSAQASTCYADKVYSDGTVVYASDCSTFGRECSARSHDLGPGDEVDEDFGIESCTEYCQETRIDEEHHGTFIRGVPTLTQYVLDDRSPILCGDEVLVGCGPIAGASLIAWYDGIGWPSLSRAI